MEDGTAYEKFLEVEKLETLLEDLEDAGVTDNLMSPDINGDLRARVLAAHVGNVEELRARIAALHSRLDVQEQDK